MRHSSHSIGALAAALAKAQAEIQNPEKSLTATIVSPFSDAVPDADPDPAAAARSFRRTFTVATYFPLSLSSGLILMLRNFTTAPLAMISVMLKRLAASIGWVRGATATWAPTAGP
jgi:hypothetical protein